MLWHGLLPGPAVRPDGRRVSAQRAVSGSERSQCEPLSLEWKKGGRRIAIGAKGQDRWSAYARNGPHVSQM